MKRTMCLLTALLLLLTLAACGPVQEGPTTVPTTEPATVPTTQPTTAPTTEPTTVPTEPPTPDTPWLTSVPEARSYEEYFSEVRIFSYEGSLYTAHWKVNDDGTPGTLYSNDITNRAYELLLDENGFRIVATRGDPQKTVWTVPGSEALSGIDCYVTDGHYAYCIRNQSEIFRLDLLTGGTETLCTAESIPVDSKSCLSLHDQTVLVYLSRTGDHIAVNRLYLPTMTLDVLYDSIPADAFLCKFSLSYDDTEALTWSIMDPDFIPRLMDVLDDPDSEYREYVGYPYSLWDAEDLAEIVAHRDYITVVQHIEIHEEIPSLLSCYLDIPSGTYEENAYYWCPDLNEPRGYQDVSFWAQLYIRFSDPEAEEPVTDTELAEAFDKSPFSFIMTLSADGPWNESREDIARQLVAAKLEDADAFIQVLEEELRYYRTASSKAQPVCQLTQRILDECLLQMGAE